MKKYSRVSYDVRCQIDAFLQVNLSIPEIAIRLGFNKSTIYRELKRNLSPSGGYSSHYAQLKSEYRYQKCRRPYVIKNEVLLLIKLKLQEGWSPQQISGRLKQEHGKAPSHTSIYNHIYNGKKRSQRKPYKKELAQHLRRFNKRGAGRHRQRQLEKRVNRTSISYRPQIANERRRIGDWERDTMYTKNGVQILVLTDRKSRLTKLKVLSERTNKYVDNSTVSLIKETGRRAYTMTNDNGGDFKGSKDLPYKLYFCDPHKPQQRGTVENTIGLLRQYIKRQTDVSTVDLKGIEEKINMRPRKILDYQTPHEVYYNNKVALAVLI